MSQSRGQIGVTTYRTHLAREAAGRLKLLQRIEVLEERLRQLEAARAAEASAAREAGRGGGE